MYDISEMIDAGNAMPGSFSNETAKGLRLEFERLTLVEITRLVIDGICYEDPAERDKWDDLANNIERLSGDIAALDGDCLEALRAKTASQLYWYDYGQHDNVWRRLASPDRSIATEVDAMLSMAEAFCGDYKRALFDIKAKDAEQARALALAHAREQLAAAKAA